MEFFTIIMESIITTIIKDISKVTYRSNISNYPHMEESYKGWGQLILFSFIRCSIECFIFYFIQTGLGNFLDLSE